MAGNCRVTMPILPPLPAREVTELAAIEREKLAFDKEKEARERWLHEDALVDQRITWLIQTQGVIGTAYAFLRYRVADILATPVGAQKLERQVHLETLHQFERILQLVGFITSLSMLIGVCAAFIAQIKLKQTFSRYVLDVSSGTTAMGRAAGISMPAASVLAWIVSWVI